MIKKWQVIRSQNVNSYRVFSTRRDVSLSPTSGEEHDFYVVEAPDWVNVVATTPQDEIILIEQYRHGIRSITLEIPGGMVDEGESPLEAGKRELLEETGYVSNEWMCIGKINPNPAIQNNACYTYLATNSKMVRVPNFEGTEEIVVSLTPSNNIMNLVAEGKITHALVVVAFYWYFLYKQHYRPLTDK